MSRKNRSNESSPEAGGLACSKSPEYNKSLPSGNVNASITRPKVVVMYLSEIPSFCAHDAYGKLRVSEVTFKQIYRSATARLIDFFEDIRVAEIKPVDLIEWQEWLDSRGTAVPTRNTYVRTVRALFNHLRSRGVEVCDTAGIFKFKKEPKRGVKSISSGNAWKMLAATGIRDTAILWLAMDSARRRGGLAGLKLDDFKITWNDEIEEYYIVGVCTEKGDKEQILMAYHGAALAVKSWLIVREELLSTLKVPDHGFLFVDTRNGRPLAKQTMSGLTTKISQKAGIPANEPTFLHSFRHRKAKQLLKDLDLATVRDILGHTSIKTTADIYAVHDYEELMDGFFKRTNPENR